MASTILTDVNFQSEVFAAQMQAAFTHKLELLNSGAMLPIPEQIVSSNTTGYTVAIPMWNVLSGDSEQITSSSTTIVNNLTDIKNIAAWVEREKGWGADTMVSIVAGKDVTAEVARQIGEYWAGEVHKSMISTLTGVMTTELASTHVYDASPNVISKAAVIAARAKLGDNQDRLTLAIMNSAVYNDALREQILTETPYADQLAQSGAIGFLLGAKTFQSDLLTATAGVYPTYLVAPGSLLYKFRNRPKNSLSNANVSTVNFGNLIIDIELNRVTKTAGGQDEIITRASYLTLVPGIQFDGTVASNPTNAELATGTTWTKVQTDNKLIPVVQLLTGVSA